MVRVRRVKNPRRVERNEDEFSASIQRLCESSLVCFCLLSMVLYAVFAKVNTVEFYKDDTMIDLIQKIRITISDHFLDQKIITWSKNTKGAHQMRALEVSSLVKLIRDTSPKTVVEIGSFNGVTSTILASAISHFNQECQLLCIDPFICDGNIDYYNDRVSKKVLGYSYEENFDYNTKPFSNIIRKLKGFSDKVLLPDELVIDILFIDGDHSKDGVIKDIMRFVPLVPVGKYICFHDVTIGRLGAISALLATIWPAPNFDNYRLVSHNESLLILQKKKITPITVSG
jgi:cephalosporin hydroxylase